MIDKNKKPDWVDCNGCLKRENTLTEMRAYYEESIQKIKKISFEANLNPSEKVYEEVCNKINRVAIQLLKDLKKK